MSAAPSRRAMLGTLAAVPIAALFASPAAAISVTSNGFGVVLSAYYRARDADRHDVKHGTLGAAYDLFSERMKPLRDEYGDYLDRAPSAVRERAGAYFDEMHQAEEHHEATFGDERDEAYEAVIAFPAATLKQLLLKMQVAADEDGDASDVLMFVKADLHKLAAA